MVKQSVIPRLYWGKRVLDLPPLDLTLVQRESYQWFLEHGIAELLSEVSPIVDFTGKNWELSFGDYYFGRPRLTPQVALDKGLTYDMSLKVTTTLVNKQSGHRLVQEVFLGDIPAMTQQGTFIINGIERCVVNQLVRSPGIYFTGALDSATGRTLHSAEIRPMHGSWLEFIVTRNDVLMVRIDRRRKFVASTFLRAIGYSTNEDIIKVLGDADKNSDHKYLEATLAKDPTTNQTEAVLELYRKLRPGEPIVLENAQELLASMFFDIRRYSLERVGRYKMNKKLNLNVPLGRDSWVLTKDDILGSLRSKDYLNDVNFSKWWIEQRQAFKKKGRKLIDFELKQKGVNSENIEQAWSLQEETLNEFDIAMLFLKKKTHLLQRLPAKVQRAKIYSWLAARGFSYETIKDVIDSFLPKD